MKATDRLPRPLRRLALVLAGWFLGAVVCLAQTTPGKVYVADVIVPPGDYTMPAGRIMSIIRTHAGDELIKSRLDDDVRDLFQTKAFANVQVTTKDVGGNKVNVYFWLTPLPNRVEEIVFDGAKHIKPDDLETLCTGAGLRKGMSLNPIANQAARQAILRKYQEKGRMFSSVELVEGTKAGDTRVVFKITEGPVVKVSGIEITGNEFVPDGRLKTQINTSRALFHVLGGDFVPGMVDADVTTLEKYYKGYGFQDATVTRELQWSEDHRYVKIIFHVHQGQRYRVAKIELTGNQTFSNDRLLDLVKVEPGKFFDDHVVQAGAIGIETLYGNDGRKVTVKPETLIVPNSPGEVNIKYEITERPPDTVGQIIIIGNTTTRENVIRRQLQVYPGQVLTYPDLKKSENNLARLNIFDMNPEKGIRPMVDVIDPDGPNPVKDVLVTVNETRTGSLLFGVGVNSDAGLTGSIVLNERNFDILRPPTSWDDLLSGQAFRGAGQEFRLEAVPGTQLQRYTASWREPFLFDSQYSLGNSIYYYQRIFNEYEETRLGDRITVGRRLNDLWSVSAGVRVEQVGVHNVSYFAPTDFTSVAGENFLLGLRVGVTRDTRDSYLRPTQGNMVQASFEECLGDFTFPIGTVEANQYFTVYQRADGSGRHVIALRSQVGVAGSNTPVYERFYAGGFQSMRGFEFRGVGPALGPYELGGDFLFLNSAEYQIPILANDQLYFVGFVDSGTVESKVEVTEYRVSAGVGMRIVVPMLGPVPIALDFGFPIVKAESDRKQVFSFWLGFFH